MQRKNTRRGFTQRQDGFYRSGFNLTQAASKPQNTCLSGHALTYSRQKGFTLIELLVVVLIIGILAAVALPQYQKAVVKSRFAAMMLQVKALAEAEEVYYLEHGEYGSASQIDIKVKGLSCASTMTDVTSTTCPDGVYFQVNAGSEAWKNAGEHVAGRLVIGGVSPLSYAIYLNHSRIRPGWHQCSVNAALPGKQREKWGKICEGFGGKFDGGRSYVL